MNINSQLENYLNPPNLPEIWFHGTNKRFTQFSMKHMGKNYFTSTLGMYFSQHLAPPPYTQSTALDYAENAVSKNKGSIFIYKCKINTVNPLILSSEGWYSSNTFLDKNADAIKRTMATNNHDAVIAFNSKPNWSDFILATNNPNTIQIIKTVQLKS